MNNKVHVQRARIFVKNLPFSVTDTKLKQHFEEYGVVNEVNILKKANGNLLGCGFVQFETPHGAMEAVNNTNEKMFLGRKITCQLAVYKERRNNDKNVKKEVKIKEEPEDEGPTNVIKEEQDTLESKAEASEHKRKNKTVRKRKISTNSIEADKDVKEVEVGDGEYEEEPEVKKPKLKVYSNDINLGKTVFVKNVPFTATDEDLHDCFSEYGELEYGLIVKDKYTEHSKGTAFVKFTNKEDAEKCLEAGTELQMEGNILDCHLALSKQDLEKTATDRMKSAENDLPNKKDKQRSKFPRNLHLLNEGAVLAGSTAASSVSAADMQLRLSIAQQRQRRLRAEPNIVISDRRLIVHNLPSDWTDRKLQAMCKKYGVSVHRYKGKRKNSMGYSVKEVKVMRNRTDDESSKCYAYIGCETHEIALSLLRAVNNNPDGFGPPPSPHKRPIIYFSLEDRRVLHRLDKRHQKDKQKQNETIENSKKKSTPKKIEGQPRTNKKNTVEQNQNAIKGNIEGVTVESTSTANKSPLKSRLKHNPRRQIQLHREQIKQRKHKQRLNKPMKQHRNHQKMSKTDVKTTGKEMGMGTSRKKDKREDDFSKIVAGYKNKLTAASLIATKTKWYDT